MKGRGNLKSNYKLYIVTLVIFLFALPILIGGFITFGSWLSFIDGDSKVWIGFWGSYLGGILGTVGVVYVAHLQNKMQKINLEKQFAEQIKNVQSTEKLNRERLVLNTKIKMFEDYISDLNLLHSKMMPLRFTLVKLFGNYDLHNTYIKNVEVFGEEKIAEVERKIIILIKEMDMDINLSLEAENVLYTTNTFIELGHNFDGNLNIETIFDIESLLDFFEGSFQDYDKVLHFISDLNNEKESYSSLNKHTVDAVEIFLDWIRDERAKAKIEIINQLKKLEKDI